mmetsp:Transcript_9664/g.21552  ORF Transcript_9664/g.21552 Transcript_9664/m.21552 type:complete len:830 (-) Transcript_9664:123-2612(-)
MLPLVFQQLPVLACIFASSALGQENVIPATALLQTGAGSGQQAVPLDLFEDAAPSRSNSQAAQAQMAPYDVGNGAVPQQSAFEVPQAFDQRSPQTQQRFPAQPIRQPLSLSETGRRVSGGAGGRPYSDPYGQTISGLPMGAARPPTALEMYAAQEAAGRQQQGQSAYPSQDEQLHYLNAQLARERPVSPSFDEPQQFLQAAEEQPRAQQALYVPAADAEEEARRFFEEQADLAGQDPRGQQSYAANIGEHAASGAAASTASFSQLSSKVSSGSQASNAAQAAARGHVITGEGDMNTGEEGTLLQTFTDPNLMKLMFATKDEEALQQERAVLDKQDELAREDLEVKKAFGKLKAATYHSANMSRYRLMEQEKLQTSLRRSQLLADANRYKAALEKGSRQETEAKAKLERTVHLAGAAVDRERDLRRIAEEGIQNETALLAKANGSEDPTLAAEKELLRQENEQLQEEEAKLVKNVSEAWAGPDGDPALIDASYKNFLEMAAAEQAVQTPAQKADEFNAYLKAADEAAAGVAPAAPAGTSASEEINPCAMALLQGAAAAAEMGCTPSLIAKAPTPPPAASTVSLESSRLRGASPAVEGSRHGLALMQQSRMADTTLLQANQTPSPYAPQSTCTPQCTWKCDTPKCDEVCEPRCEQPRCETRCSSWNLDQCVMECDRPTCTVFCPRRACALQNCPTCTSECSEPTCKLQCPQSQPCRNVCAVPKCDWNCRAPTDCPQPNCAMVCEQPTGCMGSVHEDLPPLSYGETSVQSFAAPISLRQVSASQPVASTSSPVADKATIDVPVKMMASPSEQETGDVFPQQLHHRVIPFPVA